MEPIVIATGNPHKVEEMRAIFGARGIAVIGLKDLDGSFTEPTETGTTFEENATIKALSYAEQTGRVCLADDSGLEVDALGGAPGVISSHYSTNGKETGLTRAQRDVANNARLLKELESVREEGRTARFVCVMCLAAPSSWIERSSAPPFPPTDAPQASGGIGVSPVPPKRSPDPHQQPRKSTLLPVTADLSRKRRTLPHWQQGGRSYFITFNVIRGTLSDAERAKVLSACLFWHGSRIRLHTVVVMPDHVHMLLTPLIENKGQWHSLSKLMHSIKGFSSHEIMRDRGVEGSLWQPESFDRIVRDHHAFAEKRRYIWLNPVRAGLVSRPGAYPFLVSPTWTPEHRAAAEEAWIEAQDSGHRPEAYATWELDPDDIDIPERRTIALSRGTFEGRIGLPGDVPRGTNGFGYDPLFLLPLPDRRSSAELSPEEKNRLSHRGAAAGKMAQEILALL